MSETKVQTAKQGLAAVAKDLDELVGRLSEDHRDGMVCSGWGEFAKRPVGPDLARLRDRLGQEYYRVAFAGAFSAGKSTLVNALLDQPGLLPAATGECTLSLTCVRKPRDGQGECIEVQYHSKDDALRYVLGNPAYAPLFTDKDRDMLGAFNASDAVGAIKEASNRGKRANTDLARRAAQLDAFLDALDLYPDRLGKLHIDRAGDPSPYLTAVDDKGIGHLLLIEQVFLYRDNPLFTRDGVEIIDLPGTDSVNERQRALTHDYLKKADAVVSVLAAKGVAEADLRIISELTRTHQAIRNKIFFVLNRFDEVRELGTKALTTFLREQNLGFIASKGLPTERFYVAAALWRELDRRKRLGQPLSRDQERTLAYFENWGREAPTQIEGDLDSDLRHILEPVFQDGGIVAFKQALMAYLKHDIAMERIHDVAEGLGSVLERLQKLLEPHRSEADLGPFAGNALSEFLDEVSDNVVKTVETLVEQGEKALPAHIKDTQEALLKGVDAIVSKDDPRYVSLQAIASGMSYADAGKVQREAYAQYLNTVAAQAERLFHQRLGEGVENFIRTAIAQTKVVEVGAYLAGHGVKSLGGEPAAILDRVCDRWKAVVRMRTFEEMRRLWERVAEPHAQGGPPTSEAMERFRGLLKDAFRTVLPELAGHLGAAFRLYFHRTVQDLSKDLQAYFDAAREQTRGADLDPPEELRPGGAVDPEKLRLNRLRAYLRAFDRVRDSMKEVRTALS